MSKSKAFIETTILADVLLKPNTKGKAASELLSEYEFTQLPVFAIKEFKGGPLNYYIYTYNKCVTEKSISNVIIAIHNLSRTPQKYRTATALEAIAEGLKATSLTTDDLLKKYGGAADNDTVQCDTLKYNLKYRIISAWKQRRKISTEVVNELACYKEVEPYENQRGLLEVNPTKCKPERECCLGNEYRLRLSKLALIEKSILQLPTELGNKRENIARKRHLREIGRKSKQLITEDTCRAMGDIYFALLCPMDADILTTNITDLKPLAESLGKTINHPPLKKKSN